MEKLESYRSELDLIDDQILDLYLQRLEIVLKIGQYKKSHNLSILDKNREQDIIKRLSTKIKDPLIKNNYLELLDLILSQSKELQKKS